MKALLKISILLTFLAHLAGCAMEPPAIEKLTTAPSIVPPAVDPNSNYSLTPTGNWLKYNPMSTLDQSNFGQAVASGDFNGDGKNDLAVGAPLADMKGTDNGIVIIYHSVTDATASNIVTYDEVLFAPNINNNQFGSAVFSYDINGDSISDLIIGALTEEPANRGTVYIYYGSKNGFNSTPDQTIVEPEARLNSGFGSDIVIAKLDNDAYPELIVGSAYNDTVTTNVGAVWIFEGNSSNNFTSAAATKITNATGLATDYFGMSTAVLDYNNDGIQDLLVGAPLENVGVADTGRIHVHYGTGSSATWVNSTTASDTTVENPSAIATDYFAYSMQSGDFNNDGKVDLAVGAPLVDYYGVNMGAVFVFEDIQADSFVDAILAPPIYNFTTVYYGWGLGTGDLNNDSYTDLYVGAIYYYGGNAYRGGLVAAFNSNSSGHINYGSSDYMFEPQRGSNATNTVASYDLFGWGLCSGDLNNDGKKDLVVGAAYSDHRYADQGVAYVYYSRNNEFYSLPDLTIDVGGYSLLSKQFGASCYVQDFNRDGRNDLLIGATADDIGGTDGGAVFVYLASPEGLPTSPSVNIIDPGDASNGFGKAIAFGDLDNDGFDDLAVGAWLDDTGGTDRGLVYVYRSDSTTGIIDLSSYNTYQTSLANSEYFGYAVEVGDIDGDNDDDLIVGAPFNDTAAGDSGRVVVFTNGGTANTLTSNAPSGYIYSPTGDTNSGFGSALHFGNFSSTTYKDLFIGSAYYDGTYTNAGAVYVYNGSVTGPSATVSQTIQSPDGSSSINQYFGTSISVLDFNQDDKNDIAIGAGYDDAIGIDAGAAFINFGN